MSSSTEIGTLDSWEANAEFWDGAVGEEGNRYWQLLQAPCLERMIPVQPDCKALDLATGNGLGARWLASKGAFVLATDGSEKMIALATRHTPSEHVDKIVYRQLDITKSSEFEALLRDPLAVC